MTVDAAEREPRVAGAHQLGQLVVDDLHDLLAGVRLFETSSPSASRGRARRSRGRLEVDVGLEQREPDLAHRARDRLVVELPCLREVAEGALELSESVSNTSRDIVAA
jgi:hypothetical protein